MFITPWMNLILLQAGIPPSQLKFALEGEAAAEAAVIYESKELKRSCKMDPSTLICLEQK